jgi:flagellar basal body-associated protein FliL
MVRMMSDVLVKDIETGIEVIFKNVLEISENEDEFTLHLISDKTYTFLKAGCSYMNYDSQPIETIEQLEDENSMLRNLIIEICKISFLKW